MTGNLLIQKGKEIFSILNFGIEDKWHAHRGTVAGQACPRLVQNRLRNGGEPQAVNLEFLSRTRRATIFDDGAHGLNRIYMMYRSRKHRIIAGVCGGIAEKYNMPPTVVRLLALLSCLLPGPQFVIYILMWIVIPKPPDNSH